MRPAWVAMVLMASAGLGGCRGLASATREAGPELKVAAREIEAVHASGALFHGLSMTDSDVRSSRTLFEDVGRQLAQEAQLAPPPDAEAAELGERLARTDPESFLRLSANAGRSVSDAWSARSDAQVLALAVRGEFRVDDLLLAARTSSGREHPDLDAQLSWLGERVQVSDQEDDLTISLDGPYLKVSASTANGTIYSVDVYVPAAVAAAGGVTYAEAVFGRDTRRKRTVSDPDAARARRLADTLTREGIAVEAVPLPGASG